MGRYTETEREMARAMGEEEKFLFDADRAFRVERTGDLMRFGNVSIVELMARAFQAGRDEAKADPVRVSETGSGLSFDALREANKKRVPLDPTVEDWIITDWTTALSGEVGELCNLIKKRRQGRAVKPIAIADEIADVQTYLDIVAMMLGVDLGAATIRKFDTVSRERMRVDVFLGPPKCGTCNDRGVIPIDDRTDIDVESTPCPSCGEE